jgi:hypothetical protein
MRYVDLKKREKVFEKNFKFKNFSSPAPFIKLFNLNYKMSQKLNDAFNIYLNAALKIRNFTNSEKIVKNIDRVKHKNISTSGIIVPKHYCSIEYNYLMKVFYTIVEDLGVEIKKWYTTLPVRIKFGDFVSNDFSIQDSGTLHVDSPTGFSTNCFAIFCNLAGDIENNFIKYWRIKKNINKIPFDFLVGKPTSEKIQKAMNFIEPLKIKLKKNQIIVADNVIYHQTIRNKGCGKRISIDNLCEPRFMIGKDVKSKHRKKDLETTQNLLKMGEDFIYHYPHNDFNFKKTFGLRSPTEKKIIKL